MAKCQTWKNKLSLRGQCGVREAPRSSKLKPSQTQSTSPPKRAAVRNAQVTLFRGFRVYVFSFFLTPKPSGGTKPGRAPAFRTRGTRWCSRQTQGVRAGRSRRSGGSPDPKRPRAARLGAAAGGVKTCTLENLFRGSAPPAFPISKYSQVPIRLTRTPIYVRLNAKPQSGLGT